MDSLKSRTAVTVRRCRLLLTGPPRRPPRRSADLRPRRVGPRQEDLLRRVRRLGRTRYRPCSSGACTTSPSCGMLPPAWQSGRCRPLRRNHAGSPTPPWRTKANADASAADLLLIVPPAGTSLLSGRATSAAKKPGKMAVQRPPPSAAARPYPVKRDSHRPGGTFRDTDRRRGPGRPRSGCRGRAPGCSARRARAR